MTRLRMTHNTLLVLRALMAEPGREMYGLEIMRAISLPSGTVYPLLDRAETAGWVQARAEKISPQHEGRPPRRYYRITPAGEKAAREEMGREADRLSALGVTNPAPGPTAPLSAGGTEIPVIVSDRQPPGTASLVSAGLDRDGNPAVHAVHMSIGPGEPEPGAGPCEHESLRLSKGVCPDCLTYVASKP